METFFLFTANRQLTVSDSKEKVIREQIKRTFLIYKEKK